MRKSKTKQNQIPIRAEGTFPKADRSFKNIEEFRDGLPRISTSLPDPSPKGFCLMVWGGTCASAEFTGDQKAIDELCQSAANNNEQVRDLIYEIVRHPIFRRADKPE